MLASERADRLPSPGWYANWNSDTEATVVFPGQVFRYPRGQGGKARWNRLVPRCPVKGQDG